MKKLAENGYLGIGLSIYGIKKTFFTTAPSGVHSSIVSTTLGMPLGGWFLSKKTTCPGALVFVLKYKMLAIENLLTSQLSISWIKYDIQK